MSDLRVVWSAACAAALALFVSPASAQIAAEYRVVDLGGRGQRSYAYRINERGDVVGAFYNSGDAQDYHAFLYRGGTVRELLPGVRSRAHDINDAGMIAGIGVPGQAERGWVNDNGTLTVLPGLGPDNLSFAAAVNNAGQVVGYTSSDPTRPTSAFVYSGGRMTTLGVPSGANFAWGTDINDLGQVIGIAGTGAGNQPVLYSNGTWTYLAPGSRGGWAMGVNNAGDVAGFLYPVGENGTHAYRYHDGRLSLLGPAGANSSPGDINAFGTVVGGYDLNGARHAFADDGTRFVDLNTLLAPGSGWTLSHAEGLNDRGEIVGYGRRAGSSFDRAFLLVPVPEPGGALALLACAALALYRRPTVR